jgi:hypothetical protein
MNKTNYSTILKILLITFLIQNCNRFEEKEISEKKGVYCSKTSKQYYLSLDDIKNYKSSGSILFGDEISIIGKLTDTYEGEKSYYYKIKSKETKNEAYIKTDLNHNMIEFVEIGKCDPLKFLVTSQSGIILRNTTSSKGEKLNTIPDGTELTIIKFEEGEELKDKSGYWAKTSFEGKNGYVHSAYLNNISLDMISLKKYSYCESCQEGPFFELTIGSLKESPSISIQCKKPSVGGNPELGHLEGTVKKKEYDERGIDLTINGQYTKTTFNKPMTMEDPIEKVIPIKDIKIHIENYGNLTKPELVLYLESEDTCIGVITESMKDSFKIQDWM